jgi:hypothetical protein
VHLSEILPRTLGRDAGKSRCERLACRSSSAAITCDRRIAPVAIRGVGTRSPSADRRGSCANAKRADTSGAETGVCVLDAVLLTGLSLVVQAALLIAAPPGYRAFAVPQAQCVPVTFGLGLE